MERSAKGLLSVCFEVLEELDKGKIDAKTANLKIRAVEAACKVVVVDSMNRGSNNSTPLLGK